MKNKFLTILITSFITTIGCGNSNTNVNNETDEELGTICLSPNDSNIVFSYRKNNAASLYISTITGSNPTLLLINSKNTFYLNPTYSPDGKQIAFLSFPNKSILSNIFIINSNGSEKRQVTFGDHIITEAIFSLDNKKIIYCQAEEYKHYSPIGVDAPHKFDIYEVNLQDGHTKKITNYNAYEILDISQIKKGYILMSLEDEESGIFMFPIEHPDSLEEVIPTKISKPDNFPYVLTYRPAYSEKFNKLAFYYQSGISVMDASSKNVNRIYKSISHGQINMIKYYNTQDRLIFTENSPSILRSINSDGTNLVTIDIHVPR